MKSCQQGRSMIEMLGVLAIVGVLSVGGIAGYSKAMAKAKSNMLISQISELTANIRILYSTQKSFEGLTPDILIATGFVPHEMLDSSDSSIITHVYGGKVLIYPSKAASGDLNAFEIYFTRIPRQACMSLATMDWGQDPASGFQSIYAGTAEISTPLMLDALAGDATLVEQNIYTSGLHNLAAPLTVNEASSVCSCSTDECSIGLKYL